MYEIANLPCGQRAQQRFERWLHAPRRSPTRRGSVTRLAALVHVPGHDAAERLLPRTTRPPHACWRRCRPSARTSTSGRGTVVFGHTHVALDGVCTPGRPPSPLQLGRLGVGPARCASAPIRAGSAGRARCCARPAASSSCAGCSTTATSATSRGCSRTAEVVWPRRKNRRSPDAHRRMDTFRWEAAARAAAGGKDAHERRARGAASRRCTSTAAWSAAPSSPASTGRAPSGRSAICSPRSAATSARRACARRRGAWPPRSTSC